MRRWEEFLVAVLQILTIMVWTGFVERTIGFSESPFLAGVLAAGLIVVVYLPLRAFWRRLILRVIAPVYFERNQRLREFLTELNALKTYQDLLEVLPGRLKTIFESDFAVLFVRRRGIHKVEAAVAPAPFILEGVALPREHDLLKRLQNTEDTLVPIRYSVDDLEGASQGGGEMDHRTFKVFKWAIPLRSNNLLAGFILLDKVPSDMEQRRTGTLFNQVVGEMAVILDNRKLYHRIQMESLKQGVLTMIAERLSATRSISTVFNAILDDLQAILPYDASGVFLMDADGSSIQKFLQRGYDVKRLNPLKLKIGRGIVGRCIAQRSPILIRDVKQEKQYVPGRSSTRAELCVPIHSGNRIFGAINLESNHISAYSDDDLDFLLTVATQAGVLMERYDILKKVDIQKDLREDIDKAESIQKSLLPQVVPIHDAVTFDISYLPCKQVSGDFYDISEASREQFFLTVGDVVGKGISGALIMSNFYATYLNERSRQPTLRETMISLNRYLTRDPELEHQITLFLSRLDPNAGSLEYINAGHPPPLLFHRDGTFERLMDGGSILGFDPELTFKVGTVSLEKDDLLIIYTDGLSESSGSAGQMFDESGIIRATRAVLTHAPPEISEKILQQVHEFTRREDFEDDITLLITRYQGNGS